MTITVAVTQAEINAELDVIIAGLIARYPAAEMIRGAELGEGHIDLPLRLPKIGNVTVRLEASITSTG